MPLASPTSAAVIHRSGRYEAVAARPTRLTSALDRADRAADDLREVGRDLRGSSSRSAQRIQRIPTSSPIPISAQASTSGSPFAISPSAIAWRSPATYPLRQPVVVAMQHLGRDELGLADDPIERGMLRREAEEGA